MRQQVWTGGRIGHGAAAAEHFAGAAESRREAARQRVVHAVIAAYTRAFLADRELELARQTLATANAHASLVRDLRQAGLVVESDVLQAEVRAGEVEERVIRAESGVDIARDALALVLGRDLAKAVTVSATTELDADAGRYADKPTVADLISIALDERPDLVATRLETEAARERTALERARRMPQLDLEGAYETNAESFFGADGDNWTLTAALRVPVFDGFDRQARVRRAQAAARGAEERAALHADSVALEVRRAASELAAARHRVAQGDTSVSLAERSVRIVEDHYREGLTTVTELLEAETALTRARLRRLVAQRDLLLAGASLDLAAGLL